MNRALVDAINRLPAAVRPADGGLGAGTPVGPIDFVAEGGAIANREERTGAGDIAPAAVSWAASERDYSGGIRTIDRIGRRSALLVVPANHDATNAVGFHRPMQPVLDFTPMVALVNRYMQPASPRTPESYRYATDKIRCTRDFGGIHFVFLTVWPDSDTRRWMEANLARLRRDTPVIIVTHDQPDGEAKHFTNPNGRQDVNATDQFEYLFGDVLADGTTIDTEPRREQIALESFVRRHPNVTGYFHGNANWNQFYDWTDREHSVALHTFHVDSPVKGEFSRADETKLSFQLATINTATRELTVREVLWNADPTRPVLPVVWGGSTTVALSPRP